MRGYRSRNENGELREKRGDTDVETIEKKYHVSVKPRTLILGCFHSREMKCQLNEEKIITVMR